MRALEGDGGVDTAGVELEVVELGGPSKRMPATIAPAAARPRRISGRGGVERDPGFTRVFYRAQLRAR